MDNPGIGAYTCNPVLRRLGQKNFKFKASLGYIMTQYHTKQNKG
jgi:hypothetical protein